MTDLNALTYEQRNALIEECIAKAHAEAGMLDSKGDFDRGKLRTKVLDLLVKNEVTAPAEKAAKAFHKGSLTAALYSTTPGAKDSDVLDDVQRIVWNELRKIVWNETNPDEKQSVQKSVGVRKPGALLIRTTAEQGIQVQGNTETAVYVTKDETLLFSDFEQPLRDSVRRAADKLSRNMRMLGQRQPELAERAGKDALDVISDAEATVRTTLQLGPGAKAKVPGNGGGA